jgi:hypothetical protein
MVLFGLVIFTIPNVFAVSGNIFLEKNEFTLYGDGNFVTFSINGEIYDYQYYPELEIVNNDGVIQTVTLFPLKNSLFTVIGLDKNWLPGEYFVNLIYQNKILDSKSFNIVRDNIVEKEISIHENMNDIFQSYIELNVEKLILKNNSDETITVSGNIVSSQFGNAIKFSLHYPDDTTENLGSVVLPHDGFFDLPIIGIDKYWIPGQYEIHVNYLDMPTLITSFVIENDYLKYSMDKEKLIGSFILSSEISNDFTILGITGNVETNESEMILQISKDEIILFEDRLSINENLFETNTVLYDYASNTPWTVGDYRVSGFIGDESFYSDVFRLDDQNLSIFEISKMDLFLHFETEMQKMIDNNEIVISYGEEKQIILSGVLDDYVDKGIVDVHVINPEGVDNVSRIYASSDGGYYMPIIVDDSWISGVYTAYVTYGNFIDEPSEFEVINNVIIADEILEEDKSEIIVKNLKNYLVTLDSSKSIKSIHFYAEVKPHSNYLPITISLDDEIIKNKIIAPSSEGFVDYYLLLDKTWDSGNYVVSYIENDVSVPFGTFEILNTQIVDDVLDDNVSQKEQLSQHLSLDQNIFKTSSNTVEYLYFSGKLVDNSSDKVSVFLDGDLQTILSLDSEGYYRGVISLGDDHDSGFHELSISSGNVSESAEFLIATNHYISLVDDLEITRNTIAESGGEISVFLSNMVPDFTPFEIKPVIITIEGDENYYQRFSVMPKGYGFYSQNFVIDQTIANYDVTVKYGNEIIESYDVTVILPELEWVKSHTTLWLNDEISDSSYFKKIVLLLDEKYEVTPNVTSPEWFVESADKWMNGLMDDDSFTDALLFLAENRLL